MLTVLQSQGFVPHLQLAYWDVLLHDTLGLVHRLLPDVGSVVHGHVRHHRVLEELRADVKLKIPCEVRSGT